MQACLIAGVMARAQSMAGPIRQQLRLTRPISWGGPNPNPGIASACLALFQGCRASQACQALHPSTGQTGGSFSRSHSPNAVA